MDAKDVFISYKAEEFDEADWVRSTLEQNGISCWMAPECIAGGSSYAEEIPKAIRECRVFVLLLSKKSQYSKWVPRELDQAINENKVIMPFMLENCALKDDFSFYLTNVQRYEAYAGKSAAIKKMIREIRALIGADAEREAEPEAPRGPEKIVEVFPSPEKTVEDALDLEKIVEVFPGPEETMEDASDSEKIVEVFPGPEETMEDAPDSEKIVEVFPDPGRMTDKETDAAPVPNKKKRRRSRKRRRRFVPAVIGSALAVLLLLAFAIPKTAAVKVAGTAYSREETYLSLQEQELTEADLLSISRMKKLRTLILTDCTIACEDLSPLIKEGLQGLELVDCGLTEAQIASLDLSGSVLNNVNLSGNAAVTSLEFLKPAADTLLRLNVSRTGIRDLSLLGQFPKLVTLRADENRISRMPQLSDCPKLESVSLDSNELTDLSFLEGCSGLKSLSVNGNRLSTLNGLEACIYLQELQAGSNQLTDLAGLENTTLLKFVFLNHNRLTDLSVLSHSAASLEKLYIRNNQIKELDFLSGCLSLQYLNMDHNLAQTLEDLQGCEALKALSASDNQIQTTRGIEYLNGLTYLNLSENGLTEVGVEQPLFSGSGDSVILDLSRNRLSALNIDTEVKYAALYVYGNPLKEFGRLLAAKTSFLAVDFDEGLDYEMLGEGEHYEVQLLNCPLNWQVGVKDALGYRVTFPEEADVRDVLERSYSREYIKGVEAFY